MFIGDGAKLVRDAFALAKEKSPCIIFIDEIDAIGTKRFDSELSGDREVQRTMLELLNQLDGFSSDENIKVPPCALRLSVIARAPHAAPFFWMSRSQDMCKCGVRSSCKAWRSSLTAPGSGGTAGLL
jgi:hypothetical protein